MTTLPLPDLAVRINAEHQAAHAAARTAIEHAVACGQLLIEAKRQIGHGGWLTWVEANLPFGDRQCRNYMRIARHQAEVLEAANRQRDSDLPMRAAAALLASPRTGHATIFDELADLGCAFTPTSLRLPEGLPFEDWAKIGELLQKIEAGSDDLNNWFAVQVSLHHQGEQLLKSLEHLERRQGKIVEALQAGEQPPSDAESVLEATRAWIGHAELWRRTCARYSLALANARLRDAVEDKLRAQHSVVLVEDESL